MNPVAQIRSVVEGNAGEVAYEAIVFVCPGCKTMHPGSTGLHMLPVNSATKSPQWGWNGSLEAPTLTPSILTRHGTVVDGVEQVCHSFLTDGVFEFLSDCTHSLAGQRVPMAPLEDWMVD